MKAMLFRFGFLCVFILFSQCATIPPLQSPKIADGIGLNPSFTVEKPYLKYSGKLDEAVDSVRFNYNHVTINPEWYASWGIKNRVELQFALSPLLFYWDVTGGLKIRLCTFNGSPTFSLFNNTAISFYSSGHLSIHLIDEGPFTYRASSGILLSKSLNENFELILNVLGTYYVWAQGTIAKDSDSLQSWIYIDNRTKSLDVKGGISYRLERKISVICGAGYRYPLARISYLLDNLENNTVKLERSYFRNKWEADISLNVQLPSIREIMKFLFP